MAALTLVLLPSYQTLGIPPTDQLVTPTQIYSSGKGTNQITEAVSEPLLRWRMYLSSVAAPRGVVSLDMVERAKRLWTECALGRGEAARFP